MHIIAYDLGTGGVKASLYDEDMTTLAKEFVEVKTFYTGSRIHEQRPADWWQAMAISTKKLMAKAEVIPEDVACIALSGHSLVAIPMDAEGQPLLQQVPIWSDTRAEEACKEFFTKVDYEKWYMTTGNGFPPACYSLFKLMWLHKNLPDIYNKTKKVLGSKDYINLKLTGNMFTDHSYASGTGAYDLLKKHMNMEFLEAANLSVDLFPEIVPSHQIVGRIKEEIASEIGLCPGTPVACGGVDNACMALGAIGPSVGKIYTSLGSSSWVPVNSFQPVLDFEKKPYVFAHIEEGMYTSAFSIFAGGSSLRWAKEVLCSEWSHREDVYDRISHAASSSPLGANNIFFNPSLAGGTSQDKSVNIRGGFIGLQLGSTRNDMLRAVMEGIALNLNNSINYLKDKTAVNDEIIFCGGGSKSPFWMQMFADVFNMNVIKTNIDQDAASIGAAAIAAKAIGLWEDYSPITSLHHIEEISRPDSTRVKQYKKLNKKFNHVSEVLADLGDYMENE